MEKRELVSKSNRLVEASYRLSLNEQRIVLYAICRSREEQKGFTSEQPIVITAEAFSHQFPNADSSHVYRQLKEAMDALYDRSVTLYETDEDTGKEQVSKTRWISKASYVDGAGRIKVVFTPDVIKYFTRLEKQFTSYELEKVGSMTSSYAVRFYELLTQHRKIGNRTVNLKWLREMFQLEASEYKLTADFIKRVVNPSVEQINKHSDLFVSYKTIKTGRAITDFTFKIKEKNPIPSDQAYREQLEAQGQQRIDSKKEKEEKF